MAAVEYRRVCINRWLGRCPDCIEDYDPNHHPNNLDCPSYKPITVHYFNVEENRELNTELTESKEAEHSKIEELVAVK